MLSIRVKANIGTLVRKRGKRRKDCGARGKQFASPRQVERKGGGASCYSFVVPRFFPMRRRFRRSYGVQPLLRRIHGLACLAFLGMLADTGRAQSPFGSTASSAPVAEDASVALEVAGRLSLSAKIQATAGEEWVRVFGRVTDENQVPILAEIEFVQEGRVLPWRPCSESLGNLSRGTTLRSDQDGSFCGMVETRTGEGPISVRTRAEHYEAATTVAPVDNARDAAPANFISAPDRMADEGQLFVVELLASSGQATGGTLSLELECAGSMTQLGEEGLRGSTMLRFEFVRPSVRPGPCRFVATTAVSGRKIQSERDVLVAARVHLESSAEVRKDAQLELTLVARALDTPVDEGIVEARVGEEFASSAPVRAGKARLRISLESEAKSAQVRFVPSNPAHLPGPPLTVDIPRRKPSSSWAPWHALLLLALAAWITLTWIRPKKRLTESEATPPQRPTLQAAAAARGRIRGQIIDADSSQPIRAARVRLERLTAQRTECMESTQSDEEGHFFFEREFVEADLLFLSVQHEHYMTLRSRVESAVSKAFLQTRRRAVIAHLIAWAERRGRPWSVPPVPTTGHIERVAEMRHEGSISSWAAAVGRAAYGPEPPSEDWVSELREPGPNGPSPPSAPTSAPPSKVSPERP